MFIFRSVILALVLAYSNANLLRFRSLSEDLIAGFEPKTDVSDHKRIDLDQAAIEGYLDGKSEETFTDALNVYEKGAFSKTVAKITLDSPLTVDAEKGSDVFGLDIGGGEVRLKAYKQLNQDDTQIQLQYVTEGCYVGGLRGPQNVAEPLDLTDSADQIWDGCLAESGSINIGGTSFSYTYSLPTNWNGRTIAQFSTTANTRMRPDQETAPYFDDFQKFFKYYGKFDYANDWIRAALGGKATNFQRGDADFSIWSDDFEARAEAAKKGSSYMAVMMYVIRELEDAIYDCTQLCDREECNDDAVHALDEAVAFYTGSLEGSDGDGGGVLMYALADKRAANFKTAGPNGNEISGKSKINYDIFKEFGLMQDKLAQNDCTGARTNKERIAQLIFVPLVQGTLRYAHIVDTDLEATNKAKAEGATFAAAVLPVVAACNDQDAETIYQNMKVGANEMNGAPDFQKVKKAFEDNYECMGITCGDVGGIWNKGLGRYESGAEPCDGAGTSSSSSSAYSSGDSTQANNVSLAVGVIVGVLVLILLVFFYCKCCRKDGNKSEVEFKSGGDNVAC